jgi:hypothetical protein
MVGGGTEKVLLALAYWHVYRWRTTSPVHGKSTPGSNEARNTSAFVVCVPELVDEKAVDAAGA